MCFTDKAHKLDISHANDTGNDIFIILEAANKEWQKDNLF